LLSPIQLSPVIPKRPYQPYFRPDTCSERSDNPAWLVENLSFVPNPAASADSKVRSINYALSLNLTNWSNGERISCSTLVNNSTLDQTFSERWLDCKSEPNSAKISSTRVMFDKEYKLLGINQIWSCDEPYVSLDRTLPASRLTCERQPRNQVIQWNRHLNNPLELYGVRVDGCWLSAIVILYYATLESNGLVGCRAAGIHTTHIVHPQLHDKFAQQHISNAQGIRSRNTSDGKQDTSDCVFHPP